MIYGNKSVQYTSAMNDLSYYTIHSKYSDPGSFAKFFNDLPSDVTAIASVVHGLVIHQDATNSLYHFELSKDRELEANTRYIEQILEIIIKRNDSPLSITREPNSRFVGSCRDFALLTCSILRAKGIPARLRCGFATYFHDDWFPDHWVCEYWDLSSKAWRLVDSELGEEEKDYYHVDFDHINISRENFLVAGKVWLGAKNDQYNPDIYGVKAINIKGLWFIRADVYRDLASLNKIELLPWDYTKYYDQRISELSEIDLLLTDQIANIISQEDVNFTKTQQLYRDNPKLQVTSNITSYTNQGPKVVNITDINAEV